ncbi:transcription factor bHLH129 [Cicer arietinum]|uniref:Transcription factor bHLH128-like n=1 Tax=Cicer arietinum TaxID=3827 RepID=A0A1S2Y1U3_CICAR|nr:transcription factor bHLH128-like [Cicer arietinum]
MYRPPSSSASSSSSSSQQQTSSLTRYGSAPGSLLTTTVDAVIASGGSRLFPPGTGHYFSGDSTQQRSSSSSYDAFDGSALLRQKSSPAGFLNHLAAHNHNAGFTITRGDGGQGQECLSRISENGPPSSYAATAANNGGLHHSTWGADNSNNNSNSIVFSSNNKRSRNDNNNNNDDEDPDLLLHCLNALETQYSLPQTSLEMASVDKLLHIPQDSVPCKIRAKRGCATHPRSIAERERRTRISGKLKKLQDLVPNMDKQTSYSDMLDLAVQHIKGLQTQVQKLHGELENCSCGCKPST